MRNFKTFGVMLDMSRNAVMTVESLKSYMTLLGVKTHRTYQNGDKEALRSLALNEYTECEKLLRAYIYAFRKQCMKENKPHGFEVIENRLGGLLLRTASCKQRILDYTSKYYNVKRTAI